jgi:hypothetical protein
MKRATDTAYLAPLEAELIPDFKTAIHALHQAMPQASAAELVILLRETLPPHLREERASSSGDGPVASHTRDVARHGGDRRCSDQPSGPNYHSAEADHARISRSRAGWTRFYEICFGEPAPGEGTHWLM